MFTGIVDHCGSIREIRKEPDSLALEIDCRFEDLAEGESIAADGACLTAVRPAAGIFRCQLSPETLAMTVAGSYCVGTLVNLERALRLSDRIGGHIVTGHIDQACRVARRETLGEYICLVFGGVRPENTRYLHRKCSICIQGVSLTVNQVHPDRFEVMLIPHTLERTNLNQLREGDPVNVEFDWMTKVILKDVEERIAIIEGREARGKQ